MAINNTTAVYKLSVINTLASIVNGEKYEKPNLQKIVDINTADYDLYKGTYKTNAHYTITITKENNELWVKSTDVMIWAEIPKKFRIYPMSETQFFGKAVKC